MIKDPRYHSKDGVCNKTDCPMCGRPDRGPLGQAVSETLSKRGSRYGNYDHMSYISQRLKDTLREGETWGEATTAQKEALEMIATKLARLVCGDPDHLDSWHDIQGYAKLAEDRCPRLEPIATS